MTTIVIYRKDPEKDGGAVFALFPFLEGSPGYCATYQHVGQHSSADYTGCVASSKPATPEEYAGLHNELVDYGYDDLVIYKRQPAFSRAEQTIYRNQINTR